MNTNIVQKINLPDMLLDYKLPEVINNSK